MCAPSSTQALFKGKFNSYDVWNEVLHHRRFIDECNLWDDVIR